jgi:phenylpropionate dioxygenase-like ring-hydroxylating dioxygenase large terminal subunit
MEEFDPLRRFWFPLCRSSELSRHPLRRELLGAPVVLFRAEGGQAAALADRCPHRGAPLSAGWVRDGLLACPYHGWSFDSTGACRAVPGLVGPPAHRTRVATPYGAAEQDGLVWVTLDAAAALPLPPPLTRRPGDTVALGEIGLEAGLVDALENFLDPTHTHFVHAGMVRGGLARKRVTAIVRGGADRIEAVYVGEGRQSGLVSRLFGAGVDSSVGRYIAPATVELEYRTADRTMLLITLYFTPAVGDRLRIFALAVGDTGPLPGWLVAPPFVGLLRFVAWQDQRILGLQLANVRRFGGEHYASTELDLMRPHIVRLLRAAADGTAVEPFERRVTLLL